MAMPNHKDLTEEHLALHQQRYETKSKHHASWAEQVVREERMQAFHSQSGMLHSSEHGAGPGTYYPPPQRNVATNTQLSDLQKLDNSMKLFSPKEKEHVEAPIQRFLTPGSSDPTTFAKPALNALNVSFGSMDMIEKRESMARANVAAALSNKKVHQGSESQQKVDGDTSAK